MKDVLMIKLVTGEDIIAQCDDLGNAFVVEKPMQLVLMPDERGNMSVSAQTYAPYIKGAFVISKAAVVLFGTPDDALLERYQEQNGMIITAGVSSGIITG